MKKLLILLLALCIGLPIYAQDDAPSARLLNYRGQEVFLSGINLAWISFAYDLKNFNEPEFVAALDEIGAAKGNTLRWWLHTNGVVSPLYGEDGKVIGLGEHDIETIHRALDLAYERGIMIILTLWSHDMLQDQQGVPTVWNQLMIEDRAYTQAYIDNALIPMVRALKGHPGIAAWEIVNEPEGITTEFGWTPYRTEMAYIQQFVNLLAGAIHREDPDVMVTNGSWNMRVLSDIEGMFNYYRDDRLIAAGGDPDGILDFYQAHYYPEHFDETTSPFHNPYSHWELDKPLVIGEFPAKAIADLGMGFRPRRQLRNSMETYEYLLTNGYAGAVSWTFYTSPFGKMLDAAPGMLRVNNLAPEVIQLEIGAIDRIPVIQRNIDNLVTPNDVTEIEGYVNLQEIFLDNEDGTHLDFALTHNSNEAVVEAVIDADGSLSLKLNAIGTSALEITATDSSGNYSRVRFVVQVVDPNSGNVALGKRAISSTLESTGYAAENAVDGLLNTRWSTSYADEQTLDVDLGAVYTLSQFILRWEAAFGEGYEIQVWDSSAWQTVYSEPAGDGQIDDISLVDSVDTRYVRLNAIRRGTQWGFSLWEFEIYGIAAEAANVALETPPNVFADVAGSEPIIESVETLVNGFEAGADGWQLADYWSAGSAVGLSSVGSSEGSQALAISASYSGTGWEEAGVFIQPAGGVDWSAYDQLAVDIYLPEGADNFIAQIFVKTGSDWAWANTADTPLVAGQWTTVIANLGSLGDASAINEYGIKVGTSVTAFEGDILVDNLRLVEIEEVAGTTLEATTVETLVNGFEAGADGWQLADYWSAGSAVGLSSAGSSEGSQALAISASYSGTGWEEAGVFIQPLGGVDWSAYDQLAVDIYLPEGADNFIAQIFVKTGSDWTWANTADTPLVAGQWTTVIANLGSLGDASAINEYGIKVGTSVTAFEGDILVDNLRLVSIEILAAVGVDGPNQPLAPEVYAIQSVVPLQDTVGLYEKIELVVDINAVFNNPYDPNEIQVDAYFVAPSGVTVVVPAFYYRDFDYSAGILRPTNDWSWRVRFTPTEVGTWQYHIQATTQQESLTVPSAHITVTGSDNPGFVRVDSRNSAYFAFDNGTPYFPIGQNVGWSIGANPIKDYQEWFRLMGEHGANFARVWMAPWGFSLEWMDTGLGNYDRRQAQAYQLDQVIEVATEYDIYIMLTLLNHGQYSETTNPQWAENPFNMANGGPLQSPIEFATNPEAIRLWHQRLRYIVARWGYSPNVMAWEWWNEINWTPLVQADILAPWMENSAAYVRSLDPTNRLITHSGSPSADESVWGQAEMSFTQDHKYDMLDLARTFANTIREWRERYSNKPFLMGEFGSPSEYDRNGILIHLGLWAAPMNGAAGTAMTWWWDTYIHPNNLYYHFASVAAFFSNEDLAARNWDSTTAILSNSRAARVVGLQAADYALLWVVNKDYNDTYFQRQYQHNLRDNVEDPFAVTFPEITNLGVTINNLPTGRYFVEVWDAHSGAVLEVYAATTNDGTLNLTLPPFNQSLALKTKPE